MKNKNRVLIPIMLATALTVGILFGYFESLREETVSASTTPSATVETAVAAAAATIVVPANTGLKIRLDNTVSSRRSRPGDTFQGTLNERVAVDDRTAIPKNARVKGRVVDARASGRLRTPARLVLALDSVEVGGKWYEIRTNSVGRTGKSHKKRNLVLIGGGTGLGTAVGALAGGGVGALVGAAAGAGAGTTGAALTGKKDISFPAETLLNFRLRQPLTLHVRG